MTFRSVLFVPAANAKAMAKAPTLDVDAIIIDLEDALAPQQKDQGRAAAISFLRQFRQTKKSKKTIAIRINKDPRSLQRTDIMALANENPFALVIPKVETIADLQQVNEIMQTIVFGPNQQKPSLWAMIETPLGVLNLPHIAEAGGAFGLSCLIAGTNDLAAELRCQEDVKREAMHSHLAQIVLVGRAYGLSVFDGVYNKFTDETGFVKQAKQGKALGFDGKTLIHPSQIDAANTIFGPTAEQIKQAKAIIRAFGFKKNAGKGAINVNGQMVERLHLAAANKLLSQYLVKE